MDSPLAQLRSDLANARTALRAAKDDYTLAKAQAEQHAGVDGKNEAERTRKLTIAIAEDVYHNRALAQLRAAEHIVDRLEAQIESLLDDRRAWEWSIRSALVDTLGQAGKDDGPAFDEPLDEVAVTAALDYVALRRQQRQTDYLGDVPPLPADAATDTQDWYGR